MGLDEKIHAPKSKIVKRIPPIFARLTVLRAPPAPPEATAAPSAKTPNRMGASALLGSGCLPPTDGS